MMKKCIAYFVLTVLVLFASCADVKGNRPADVTTTSEQTSGVTTTAPAVATTTKPGDLPSVDSLPVADQTSVGKTVELSLKSEYFYYYYDAQSSKERLIVIDLTSENEDGGILYIYETDLNGLGGLCSAISSPIQGKVLAVSTISFYEVMYASWGLELTDWINEAEVVSLDEPTTNPNTAQRYISVVDGDLGEVVLLAGNLTAQDSEYLTTAFDVMDRIIDRFDLGKYL